MHLLILIFLALASVAIGYSMGRRRNPRLPPPPIEAADVERLEPHHSIYCDFNGEIWRCYSYCDANAWRKKNAGRPIVEKTPAVPSQLPVAKIARAMKEAEVIDLKRRK